VYGAGSVHTAVGIYQQDLLLCVDAEAPTPTTQGCHVDIHLKKKQRELKEYCSGVVIVLWQETI